jgi:amino acid transporter
MAELAVDQPRLLKTMRWWDGFIIGLANPGFLLAGLAGSVVTLGPKWAAIIWFSSAVVGALQAYVYAEPAAMFPDKSGGLSMYAKEGWRKHFSLAGPIATFGYWFAWSSVLAIYGGIIGTLLLARFWPDTLADPLIGHLAFIDITWPRVIGGLCIASCFIFNIRGMRPAVWFSYVTGAMMIIPVAALAIIPLVNGDITSHALGGNFIEANVLFYDQSTGTSASGFSQLAMGIVWFWVIAWSTYGPEAPATFAPEFVDTRNDTRLAIISTGSLNVVLSLLLPLTIVGVLGTGTIAADTTFIAYITEALDQTVGDALGGVFVVFVCAGLLLSMNTATMDGSRALYGMAREGLTFRQLDRLNAHSVPSRAMTVDMVLNLLLLFIAPTLLFTLVAGNIGYVLSHVFALSGFLLLRRDRPDWPRPLRHGPVWIVIAWLCLTVNVIGTVFGVIWIHYTGYLYKVTQADPFEYDPKYYAPAAIITGVLVLVVGVVGYIVGQRQHGRKFSFKDASDEQPSPEVYALMGAAAPAAGD